MPPFPQSVCPPKTTGNYCLLHLQLFSFIAISSLKINLVDEGAVSANNLDGRETFDETTAVFDVKQFSTLIVLPHAPFCLRSTESPSTWTGPEEKVAHSWRPQTKLFNQTFVYFHQITIRQWRGRPSKHLFRHIEAEAIRLGSSAEEFSSVCSKLIARMIDVGPQPYTVCQAKSFL